MDLIVYDGKICADSREVAEMVGKRHDHLYRDIQGYVEVISENPNLGSQDYFIPSTYKVDGNNKTYPCYLLTKMGCEMVANKLTGKKGILFTAAYVKKFNDMEKQMEVPKLTPTPRYRSRRLSTAMEDMEKTAANLCKMFKVNAGIAYSKAISMIEPLYGVSFDNIKDLLPAATHDTGYMNPTQVGEKFQGKSAREINLLLAGYGLQHKEGKCWRLDDAGREYGEEVPYTRNGHSGYDIRWNDKLISLLQEKETLVIEKA